MTSISSATAGTLPIELDIHTAVFQAERAVPHLRPARPAVAIDADSLPVDRVPRTQHQPAAPACINVGSYTRFSAFHTPLWSTNRSFMATEELRLRYLNVKYVVFPCLPLRF